jgi:precorrin-6A/cobalt-precorrin-6A reductase
MKRVLVLGGTAEALAIARTLGKRHVYSLAGLGKVPQDLDCRVRVGGFGGISGLAQFIRDNDIDLLLDATHPYAAQISTNAVAAAAQTDIPCWALRRQGWQAGAGDDWRFVDDWAALIEALAPFQRPFLTMGREPLVHLDAIPQNQFWTIRCLTEEPGNERAKVIGARGPFTLVAERALFADGDFDVLISKNSGSVATEPKLQVARERRIPVLILQRPVLPPVSREFESTAAVMSALQEYEAGLGGADQ